jgi:hypothetical protein
MAAEETNSFVSTTHLALALPLVMIAPEIRGAGHAAESSTRCPQLQAASCTFCARAVFKTAHVPAVWMFPVGWCSFPRPLGTLFLSLRSSLLRTLARLRQRPRRPSFSSPRQVLRSSQLFVRPTLPQEPTEVKPTTIHVESTPVLAILSPFLRALLPRALNVLATRTSSCGMHLV